MEMPGMVLMNSPLLTVDKVGIRALKFSVVMRRPSALNITTELSTRNYSSSPGYQKITLDVKSGPPKYYPRRPKSPSSFGMHGSLIKTLKITKRLSTCTCDHFRESMFPAYT
jgi:hypothetical protein